MEGLVFYPEKLPFYPSILNFLEHTFFLVHILLVNLILGWALFFAYQQFKKNFLPEIALLFLKKKPILFALAINMAIPALLFLQVVYGPLFFTSSIILANHWMLIIPSVILVYYLSYLISKKISLQKFFKPFIFIQVFILLYIAFILVNNLTLMENPEKWNVYFTNRKGTYLPLDIPYLYFKYLHFLVGSLAVSGLSLGILGHYKKDKMCLIKGLNLFFSLTLLQIVVGIAFLLSLPSEIRGLFLGNAPKVAFFFYLSIVFALTSLYFSKKHHLKLTTSFFILTLIFMVVNRFNLRTLQLSSYYQTNLLQVSPQMGVFLLFLLFLGLGIVTVYYFLKHSFSKQGERKI
ncbi:hypothetical protein [Thermodesulfobacterium thermophilum]|uniref:hypothetical protein n=1 Tax=Thermodesulfobacterium thermophilum TaxID=886 RepID=UPI0003B649DD|nr:hypothetical protein [Thermodesulfobacterium thermophilum]